MIKVVSFKICPFVQRVTALLEAKNMPYEIEYINLSDKPAWFLALSPTGQVPLLMTENGVALFESDAIIEYIEEISDPDAENGTPEQRAIDRAWSYQATKHYLVQCSAMQSANQETLAERSVKLNAAFEKAENQLGGGPYFHGAHMGKVDIAWLPILHRAQIVEKHSGYDFLASYPKVKAWQVAMSSTGVAEQSVPDDFEQAFSNFYLADRTFLGRGANFDEGPIEKAAAAGGGCCC